VPHETTKGLALLLAYALLFVVVVQRIETLDDIKQILRCVGVSAVLMGVFGLVQYFTANGRFFWFYEHPYRSTEVYVCGSFMNRNHFASFLALGVGPLAAWLLETLRQTPASQPKNHPMAAPSVAVVPLLLCVSLAGVLFAILSSLSRGGTLALVTVLVVTGTIYARGRLVDAKYLWGLGGIAVVLVGMLSINGYDAIAQRLGTLTTGSIDAVDRNEGRRKIWNANIEAFRAGGLAGAGVGSQRMIYPVYLDESLPGEYTHAESSYLQLATETGAIGVMLLVSGLGLCGFWCLNCLRNSHSESELLYAGAICGGLAASAVHSIADFVWYIPACLSVAAILAACALRLAQITCIERKPGFDVSRVSSQLKFAYRLATPLVAAMGIWTVWTFVGPAVASIHWDRYLRVSVALSELNRASLSNLVDNDDDAPESDQNREAMQQAMLRHLEKVVAWDPDFAPARIRLANQLVKEFERRQRTTSNAMDVSQIRDAALASQFKSPAELRGWLSKAFGDNCELLSCALLNARAGLAKSPLEGSGYLTLAELCFLEGGRPTDVAAYIDQGLHVRPYDGDLLFEVGKQALVGGDVETAMRQWAKCFRDTGPHQLKIVYLLAGRIPASLFIEGFQPDWHTLPHIWTRYRDSGQPQDLIVLVNYSAQVAQRQALEKSNPTAESIWRWQAAMYRDLNQPEAALACLQRAYQADPRIFEVRYQLGHALMAGGRFAEAEPHLRWCLARRPGEKSLSSALAEISERRREQLHSRDPDRQSIARVGDR
jgi:O-antigen ligase/tetratricopeptide (TPR) repeat protein